jgi:MMP 1-O-methyltransferase
LNSIVYSIKNNVFFLKLIIPGMVSLPQCVKLHDLASVLSKNSTIVEIGCYAGLSTAFLIAGSKNKSTVFSIDPFDSSIKKQKRKLLSSEDKAYSKGEIIILDKKPSKEDVEKCLWSKKLTNFKLYEGYSNDAYKNWKRNIDMLWIDGDHNYRQVKRDFLQWSKFLKKGGIVAIDDANMTGESEYWNMGLIGPTMVVNEYIRFPKWVNIGRIDAMVYATKNY